MNRLIVLVLLVFLRYGECAERRPIEVQDLFRLKRVSEPQISPDGTKVVYQLSGIDFEKNRSTTNLWLAETSGSRPPRPLTSSSQADRHPRWSPDGKKILFESTRSGSSQLWVISLDGGEAQQMTTISTGATNGIWSRDGRSIAFVSSVYPEFSGRDYKESNKLNRQKLELAAKSTVKARVFTRLFYRHWVEYVEDRRNHLYVMDSTGGDPRDVTPGDRDAYPTSSTFSGGDDFTFSPNGAFLFFTAVPERDEAWSTNYDICRVPVKRKSLPGGEMGWENVTAGNLAADGSPCFSPDGKHLAYRAQKKPGYEADKWDLMIAECDEDGTIISKPQNRTQKMDISIDKIAWNGNNYVIVTADEEGVTATYRIRTGGTTHERFYFAKDLQGQILDLSIALPNRVGSKVWTYYPTAFTLARMNAPPEIYFSQFSPDDRKPHGVINLSEANKALLSTLELPRPESVSIPVKDAMMQMWILKPPGFKADQRWPVVYLVHGGPQGAWTDGWSFRWNPEVWAAQGYVVAMPNPRGSTGFGQKFVDDISADWGGKCYEDLMLGADYVEKLPYVDKTRIAAAGGSFGGYMMNWFAVSTPRFKTLISHCSVWNFESMWGTTDELWFDEYEHGGLPWDKPESYAKFSPHKKAAQLGTFKTPMLLIQNDLDFRCPVGQGHELFSALQRQRVPSRLINFPDEGHWVLKPQNSDYWHKEVFSWLKKYCPAGGK